MPGHDASQDAALPLDRSPSRRHLLRSLGALAAGAAFAPWLPAEAAATSGTISLNAFLLDYARFLARLRLRNIKVLDVVEAHTKSRGEVKNTAPPRSLWLNIVPTLRVADRLASYLRSPLVEIVSAYRSPAYNARCPGARRESYHTRNMALDLRYDCAPSKVAAMAKAMRDRGLFKGGIGRYGSFTHVDTRGENVDWSGW